MKAIVCSKYGQADVLEIHELATPKPSSNEVLVEIKAASINPVDWKIRSGALKVKTGLRPPKILGSDFSGVIRQVGSKVSEYQVGHEVWGKFDSFKGGAYAQMAVAKASNIGLKPNELDYFEAASMPNVALTALQAMTQQGGLKNGQRVLINGASGGVGLMGLQIAKAMKCHVTAVCSSKNKDLVKSLGADVVLDYQTTDILAMDSSYDVFFDSVSNQTFFKVKTTLKPGGVHVKTTPDLFSILGRLLDPFGFKRADHIMVKPSGQHLQQLKGWVDSDQLKPIVQQVFPMSEVQQAHRLSQSGRVVGKLILAMKT